MVVKKTKNGKFSFEATWVQREHVFMSLCNFLETESVMLWNVKLKEEKDILRHLYASVLNEFITRRDFQLTNATNTKWTLKKSEAIALMWLLRGDKDLNILELKSALHKSLS